ncbi:MAG: glycosyl hydrolase family 2 [Melioribacteraceae bacterium]|nr:glycosyl hydrolase family 2 [Melioribacteraceae bacterium]
MIVKKLFYLFAFAFSLINAQNKLQLPAIIGSNMVLQQKSSAPIWGKGEPGSEIEIKCSWSYTTNTVTTKDSTWKTELLTPSAGGPYKIEIISKNNKIVLTNILIGEVWLCSGQSNMEMPLEGLSAKDSVLNSKYEILNANNPNIRLFTVTKIASLTPKSDCIGEWNECNSENVKNFSAVAYLFGKKLFEELNVPIGLIHSSWGGTAAEVWIEKKSLLQFKEFDDVLQNIEATVATRNQLFDWLKQFPSIEVKNYNRNDLWNKIDFNDAHLSLPDIDDSYWRKMVLPINWEKTDFREYNGFVWFRKKIELPKNWVGKDLTIELGAIDDYDVSYVNGKKIGEVNSLRSWKNNRVYTISKDINDSDILTIAVRVHDSGGVGGGIYGGGFRMRLILNNSEEEIPIDGEWKYLPTAELSEMKYYIFLNNIEELINRPTITFPLSQRTPTALFNGMIAPIIPYGIKGVIWYQGESNTPNPYLYEMLFPSLINNWRENWGYEFPFYFVQIAPYKHGGELGSQYLRDAQRKTLNMKNTGMAVTLDIGDSLNVHPANKTGVADRLALWALANQYGRNIVYSGPLYKSFQKNFNKIEISFDHVGCGIVLRENVIGNQFLISGEDKIFKPAQVLIEGDKLIVWSDEIPTPEAVRYAWENIVIPTLFNFEGLPASSFRTDSW